MISLSVRASVHCTSKDVVKDRSRGAGAPGSHEVPRGEASYLFCRPASSLPGVYEIFLVVEQHFQAYFVFIERLLVSTSIWK